MDMLNDPEMRDIVLDFCEESKAILADIETTLEDFEDEPTNPVKLEEYGGLIDRIMGAAKNLNATQIGTLAELGKVIGYKAAQTSDANVNMIVCGVLFDCTDLLNLLFDDLKDQTEKIKAFNVEKFIQRMQWLSDKFKHIERASVDPNKGLKEANEDKVNLDQASIDELLKNLNL